MIKSRIQDIKHAQKESFLLRELSQSFVAISLDEPRLAGLYLNRVKLSPERGLVNVYFLCEGGLAEFEEKRPILVLYKASIRAALAKALHGRYTPEIRFMYDNAYEKQRKVDDLIERLKEEGKL